MLPCKYQVYIYIKSYHKNLNQNIMKQFLIQAVLEASTVGNLTTLESHIAQIGARLMPLSEGTGKIPSAQEFLGQLNLVNQSVSELGVNTRNVRLSLGDQASLSTSYAQIQPAFINATNAMTANAATLIEYNEDGSISNELNGIIETVDSTTADVAAIASSEAGAIEAVGDAVTSALSQVVQLL